MPREQKIRVFEAGSIPLQTICKNIRYSQVHVSSSYGVFGIKVWLLEKKLKKLCYYNLKKLNLKN